MNNKYKLKIVGKNTKRFIKELIKEKNSLYYLENHDKYSIIIVDDIGYNIIKKKKTSYKVSVIRKYGLIRYKDLIKKYSVFLISIFIGIILIELLSNIVFSIKIEHRKSEIRDLIINDLEEFGIKKYHFKVSFKKKEEIKKKILEKETDKIEWLEIEENGTKYTIKVEERIKNKKEKDNKTQNIIAKKNAMILSIDATHGEIKKKKYDYVKKGEVLISGFITKDLKTMTKTKAIGNVFGEVWYQVEVNLPKNYRVVKKTGEKTNRLELKFFNKSIFLLNNKYKSYNMKRRPILSSSIIPISFNYVKLEKTNVKTKKYTIDNISKDAIKLGEEKLKTKLGYKDSIIYKNVLKKTEKDSRIIVDVFFKVKEDITDTESIEDINIEEIKEGEEDESSN